MSQADAPEIYGPSSKPVAYFAELRSSPGRRASFGRVTDWMCETVVIDGGGRRSQPSIELTRRLKLPHIRRAMADLIPTPRAQRWDLAGVIRVLLAAEAAGRDHADLPTRQPRTTFPAGKTFGDWDGGHLLGPGLSHRRRLVGRGTRGVDRGCIRPDRPAHRRGGDRVIQVRVVADAVDELHAVADADGRCSTSTRPARRARGAPVASR